MAFDYLNPVRYDAIASVDAKFAPILEKLLWKDATFRPGITFTTKYTVKAGQIFVRKLRKIDAKHKDAKTSGGLDFQHTHTADDLIPIVLDQVFDASEKVYEVVEQARESAQGAQIMEVVVESVREKFQAHALDVLLAQGMTDAVLTASTAATIADNIVATRKLLRDNGAKPDTLIVSTRVYGFLLAKAGKDYFPNTNESILRTGALGVYLGYPVYESNLITDVGAAGSTEYVLYDHEAYSIIFALDTVRLVDAGKDFVGSYAQAQIVSGHKVTLPEAVLVKRVAAAAPTVAVTFNSDGGSAVTTQNVQIGAKATEPTAPTKSGSTFVRWDLGNLPYDFDQAVTSAITLKAIWEA